MLDKGHRCFGFSPLVLFLSWQMLTESSIYKYFNVVVKACKGQVITLDVLEAIFLLFFFFKSGQLFNTKGEPLYIAWHYQSVDVYSLPWARIFHTPTTTHFVTLCLSEICVKHTFSLTSVLMGAFKGIYTLTHVLIVTYYKGAFQHFSDVTSCIQMRNIGIYCRRLRRRSF